MKSRMNGVMGEHPRNLQGANSAAGLLSGQSSRPQRFVGIDVGSETLKLVELVREGGELRCVRRQWIEHGKEPGPRLRHALMDWNWSTVNGAAVSGRLGREVHLPHVPTKQAQARGYRFLFGNGPATILSIGHHGFSVLELRGNGLEILRENSRCSQGTGNFLRQLVERFSLTLAEASEVSAEVEKPAALSGRCPVILKTDMTHLANKGENRAEILAGLFDAVCENVLCLLKPGVNPPNVCLVGGVSRSRRVQNTLRRSLKALGMQLMPVGEDDALFLEAIGNAVIAAEGENSVPPLNELLRPVPPAQLERVAPLSDSLPSVRRMPPPPAPARNGHPADLILGFDIGSTGSKLVALDAAGRTVVWEGYRRTLGNPVGAAQALLHDFIEKDPHPHRIRAIGATGSGREIVGSLMATCYGKDAVFILNEIAAHAEGALYYDPRVDTIFEIGGQDAKYIRLADGKVVDCAMNEACSAGTGSFIEEQGRKFSGIQDVGQLGRTALKARSGVSLGRHCSVFMAEIIDEAIATGISQSDIMAGLYDSVVQNYLNRVKGNRSVGRVIFCQGMPFSADALAAAVARQTGGQIVIPPSPGTVGALGIALTAERELPWRNTLPLNADVFLAARIEQKETFHCKAKVGCGGAGNKCRIDSIHTVVAGERQCFTWGGGCSLYDQGTRKKKLPNLAPDPFREREELIRELTGRPAANGCRARVAVSDEFMLKGLYPFFAAFLQALGFEVVMPAGADHAVLKRGIQASNVPFCAPLQLYHGMVARMAEAHCDYLFVPMLRATPRSGNEPAATVCPIVQASPDILRWDFKAAAHRILSPQINLGEGNLESKEFLESCQHTAALLGVKTRRWQTAYESALRVQKEFDRRCAEIGRHALEFCAAHGIVPVVVLGRPYTIYNKVLNSNVPALLREQGAIGIPIDCFPIESDVPVFDDIYWGYSQRILRAAHQVRRTPGVYSLFCSNYGCGPDSFGLHFFSYIMEGKPFAVIETDGHSGDAGTKTRVEAFLHCVQQDRNRENTPSDLRNVQVNGLQLRQVHREERFLIPMLGPNSEMVAAAFRGLGYAAEALPMPDIASLKTGRRYTSGKECVPMCMTLGTLLNRIESEPGGKFVVVMPRTCGPCRFGVYNILNRIVLERLGWKDRVRIWSPRDTGYFDDTPPAFAMLLFAGFMAGDLLLDSLHDSRPDETTPGAANAIYRRYSSALFRLCEEQARRSLRLDRGLWQTATGHLFGISDLLADAAAEFAAIRRPSNKPTVLVVGEIYVRSVPFANDFIIEKLEQRGCKARLAPACEWIEYSDHISRRDGLQHGLSARLASFLQRQIRRRLHHSVASILHWPEPAEVREYLDAAAPYLRSQLHGEAVLTLGSPLAEWHAGHIDAAISVGPLECMPNKIAEAQFFHIAEHEDLPVLTLPLNGDPLNPETLDNFVFEIRARRRQGRKPADRETAAL